MDSLLCRNQNADVVTRLTGSKGFSAIIRCVLCYRISSIAALLPRLAYAEDAGPARVWSQSTPDTRKPPCHLTSTPAGIIQMKEALPAEGWPPQTSCQKEEEKRRRKGYCTCFRT